MDIKDDMKGRVLMSRFEELKDQIITKGLYVKIPISHIDYKDILSLCVDSFTFDSYCTECKNKSVFTSNKKESNNSISSRIALPYIMDESQYNGTRNPTMKLFENSPFVQIKSSCARCSNINKFYLYINMDYIIKIGQYPSYADLESGEISKYRKILNEDYEEFSKSIGLYAHGVGIGAYVYLRRIIERLIEEAHKKKSSEANWDEKLYKKLRFGEKVEILATEIDNDAHNILKPVYSILSKGIHELTEEECKNSFNNLKDAIEFILDGKLAIAIRESKKNKIDRDIQKINSYLK